MFPVNADGQAVLLNKGKGVLDSPSNDCVSKKRRSKNLVIIDLSGGIISKTIFPVFRANGKAV